MYREVLNRSHYVFLFHQLRNGVWLHCAISALTDSRAYPTSSIPSPMQPRSPAVVHSNPESDGGCQTYPAAREKIEPDPLKEVGESPRKNSVERLY